MIEHPIAKPIHDPYSETSAVTISFHANMIAMNSADAMMVTINEGSIGNLNGSR